MPTPSQKCKSYTEIKLPNGDVKYLDAGSYIKVVNKCYVPANHPFGDYNEDIWSAAQTKFGFALVRKSDITDDVY